MGDIFGLEFPLKQLGFHLKLVQSMIYESRSREKGAKTGSFPALEGTRSHLAIQIIHPPLPSPLHISIDQTTSSMS